jgi:hypothetical protein
MMNTWSTMPPPGIDPHVWNEAVTVAYNAHGNVCYSPDAVPLEEMRRLREDMETKSQGPINLDTLDWLWTRLAYTGPHGLKYSTQMRPLGDEMRDAVIARTLPTGSRLQPSRDHFLIASFPPLTQIANGTNHPLPRTENALSAQMHPIWEGFSKPVRSGEVAN